MPSRKRQAPTSATELPHKAFTATQLLPQGTALPQATPGMKVHARSKLDIAGMPPSTALKPQDTSYKITWMLTNHLLG